MKKKDVIIVGGGLAGLTAAIALSGSGHKILLFEINTYPHHKVCGEYVSNEVIPYLERLGIDLKAAGGVSITDFEISTAKGNIIATRLPLGGTGISRFLLDHLLFQKAKSQGVQFVFSKVTDISFANNRFTVTGNGLEYEAKVVLGAYGKRSTLDKTLKRPFSFKKQDWLAVKAHYRNDEFSDSLVALHNFEGGYGGLSKTETGAVNFCYLANYSNFKKYTDIDGFNREVVSKNPYLRDFLERSELIFDKPLAIAQIAFDKKEPVLNHILMCGDTAGLIHPLCGNGMAMAIHSAKLASEAVHAFLSDGKNDRDRLEKEYAKNWNAAFKNRLWFGRRLQGVLLDDRWMNAGLGMAGRSKNILNYVISKTHGKAIE
ncbi:NAD(P)/FAD-dependent oxidoreductase [Maribacter chungangensis]|uniref:NAD(P)/FAD-dependent oxidoreductase n=1 Tax=Maribacter chungangensis TaxID=1069117 RepID=A0ABW3B399_9FLAO